MTAWLALLLPSLAWAVSAERASTAGSFLKLPAGARAVAMGEAYAAAPSGSDALFWNPAALSRGTSGARHAAAFSHAEYLEESSLEQASYGLSGPWGGAGIGLRYLSVGKLVETDETGAQTGTFSPSDYCLSLGLGRTLGQGAMFLEGFSAGMAAKYLESRVLDTARTWAVDLAVLSPAYLGRRLSLAAVLRNLGGDLEFESDSEELPLEGRLGAAWRHGRAWLVTLDLAVPRDDDPFAGLGAEYSWSSGKGWSLAGRAGFNSRTVGDVRGFSGADFGLGFGWGSFGFDYAFQPMGSLGSPHHFTLTTSF
ncbi:MAG: PorV/PorQ family protein [Elusimicrobia bacterium]|nr:PorV/PorQ family protein [Elusimicrobiota bacterium]